MVYIVTLNAVGARHFYSINFEYLEGLFIEYSINRRAATRCTAPPPPGSLKYQPLMGHLMRPGPGQGVNGYSSLLDGASGLLGPPRQMGWEVVSTLVVWPLVFGTFASPNKIFGQTDDNIDNYMII